MNYEPESTESTESIKTSALDSHLGDSNFQSADFLPLSPHYPKINAFTSFIGWAIIFTVLFLADIFVDTFELHFLVLPLLMFASVMSAIFGFYSAKVCGYVRGDFQILFKEGIWWKRQTALSFSRVQHIDVSHGPLDRKFGMATIKFFTAGGAGSDLTIPGLPSEQAEQLRTEILQYAKYEFESSTTPEQKKNTNTKQEDNLTPNQEVKQSPEVNKNLEKMPELESEKDDDNKNE